MRQAMHKVFVMKISCGETPTNKRSQRDGDLRGKASLGCKLNAIYAKMHLQKCQSVKATSKTSMVMKP